MGAGFSKATKKFFNRGRRSSRKATKLSALKNKTLLQRANENYLATDLFSEPIQFNFKGQKSFPSLAGAILSTIVRVSILVFATTITLSLVGYQSEEIYNTYSQVDASAGMNFREQGNYQFMIGFNKLYDDSYAKLNVTVETFQSGALVSSKPIDTQVCPDSFQGTQVTNKEYGLTMYTDYTMYCSTDNSQITLSGNHLNDAYTQLTATLTQCTPTVFQGCANDLSFDNFIKNAFFIVYLPKKYINLKNHVDKMPILTKYEPVVEKLIDMTIVEKFRISLRENKAIMYDSVISNVLATSNELSFLSYDQMWSLQRTPMPTRTIVRDTMRNASSIGAGMKLLEINIEIDSIQVNHFRKQISIWQLMCYVGGFSVTMIFLGKAAYVFIKQNSMFVLSQQYLRSQYQTRTREVKIGIEKPKEKTEKDEIQEAVDAEIEQKKKQKEEKALARANQKNRKVQPEDEDLQEQEQEQEQEEDAFGDKDSDEMKEGGQIQADDIATPKKFQKDDEVASNGTEREMENEIRSKDLMHVVEELCARQRYNMNLKSTYKRYITCFDNEEDELTKKYRYMGERKLQNEMDISRILKKIRNFEAVNSYILNERQRYLLRFNSRHVIDTDSDLISLESAESIFSVPSNDEDRLRSIRQRVMIKLIQDDDLRDERCGLRLVDKDLENGVGRVFHEDDDQGKLDEESSEFVDSDEIEDNVQPNADESELAPDLIEEDPENFKKARSHRESKKRKDFDSNEASNSRQVTEDNVESPMQRIDSHNSSMLPLKDFRNELVKSKSKVRKPIL